MKNLGLLSTTALAVLAAASSSVGSLPPAGSIVTLTNTAQSLSVRHCDWQAFATPSDGSDDFHWILINALNGKAGAVSFESVNYPNYYLAPGQLGNEATRLLAIQGANADDASYSVIPDDATHFSFASLSKNTSYAGLLISQTNVLTGSCANRYGSPSGDLVLAPQGGSGVVTQAWAVAPLPPVPPAVLTVNVTSVDHVIPSRFMGCHADPGYVQAPLAFTSSMLYGNSFEGAGDESSVYAWNAVAAPGVVGSAVLDSSVEVNPAVHAPSLKVTISSGSAGAWIGWANRGIGNEGLSWQGGRNYSAMAVVFAPNGATLYLGAHDRTTGTVHASATVTVPPSTQWQVVSDVSLTMAATAGCVGIANGSDPTISCTTNAGNGGGGDPTNPGQVCVRCDGEFVIGLSASGVTPATAWIGFTDLRPGPWGTFGPRGLAQAVTVDALRQMGISVIRQGGTVSQTFAWKEWRGAPWQRAAMQHYWMNRLIPSTWGPFEFIETANAAGIEPILTFAYDLNTADDWADLIEYCWGNASTTWGAVRTYNDSHPETYNISVFELGNEQENPDFVSQVAAMEARAAAVGAPKPFYIYPSNPGTLPGATAQAILALGGPDLAARTAPDIHIWGSAGGVAAAQNLAGALPNYPSSFVNMEINARTSTLTRGIAEAADLQSWFSVGHPFLDRLFVRTTSFCMERSGHYDGYDQGIAYFLPNMTWLQPPGQVHAMASAALRMAPYALVTSVSPNSNWLASSAQISDDRTLLVVQLVNQNTFGQPINVTISLAGTGFKPTGSVSATSLSDPAANAAAGVLPNPSAGNTPAESLYIAPQVTQLQWPIGAPSLTVAVPAFSYWTLQIAGAPAA